jgi:hypothetical protein
MAKLEGAGVSTDAFSIHEFLNPLCFFAVTSPIFYFLRLNIGEIELISIFFGYLGRRRMNRMEMVETGALSLYSSLSAFD